MSSIAKVLIVSVDSHVHEQIGDVLAPECQVIAAANPDAALTHLMGGVDLVIGESSSTRQSGLELLRLCKSRLWDVPILVLVNSGDVKTAVEAMKLGAVDCLMKPVDAEITRATILSIIRFGVGLSPREVGGAASMLDRRPGIDIPPDTSLEVLERAAVEQALAQHHGNRTHAARMLGISVRTLQRKLKAWGMPLVSFSAPSSNANLSVVGHAFSASVMNAEIR